jgi:two-component system, NarL family, sensor kinase
VSENLDIILSVVITTLVILLLAVFIVFFIILLRRRQQKHLIEKQLLQSQHQQALLQTQLEIQEQTLKTISEEIHDNLSQTLGLAKLNLNNLLATLPEGPGKPKALAAKEAVARAIHDLRLLARTLHGDKLAETGLQQAIDAQLSIIGGSGQFTTALEVSGEEWALTDQQEMVLFRMAQELLHNAVKHSGGSHIAVGLAYSPNNFTLSVTDNGHGFDTAQLDASATGIGLTSLRNRAALIQATVTVESAPGKGTAVRAVIMPRRA